MMDYSTIQGLLAGEAENLLGFNSPKVSKERLHLPGPDFVDRIFYASDRTPQVLRSLQAMFDHGRLGGTGYLSILPVDQGIEHSAGASFAPNPDLLRPGEHRQAGDRGRAATPSPPRWGCWASWRASTPTGSRSS